MHPLLYGARMWCLIHKAATLSIFNTLVCSVRCHSLSIIFCLPDSRLPLIGYFISLHIMIGLSGRPPHRFIYLPFSAQSFGFKAIEYMFKPRIKCSLIFLTHYSVSFWKLLAFAMQSSLLWFYSKCIDKNKSSFLDLLNGFMTPVTQRPYKFCNLQMQNFVQLNCKLVYSMGFTLIADS